MGKHFTTVELPNGTLIIDGNVAPEGAVTAPLGSKYHHRLTGQEFRKASGTGSAGWLELLVQQVNISWTGDGPAEFVAVGVCTLSSPTLRGGGTPAVTYLYSADGNASFAAATFPLTMAAGSVLRVTLSGFNARAAWGAERR